MKHQIILLILISMHMFSSVGHAQIHAIDGDFITEWLLLGPLHPNDPDKDFLAGAGGETNVHPKEGDSVITAQGDALRWKRYRSLGSIIELDQAIGAYDSVTAYAFCILQSEAKEKAQFLLGSNDEVVVWINGEQVYRHIGMRQATVDGDSFMVNLQEGANRCLVKVTQFFRGWEFVMRAFPSDRPVGATHKEALRANDLKRFNRISFNQNWKYHSGDNPDWAKPEFDDCAWEIRNTRFSLNNPPKSGWNGIGWFRMHLAVDSLLRNQFLAFNVLQQGASEIFLDGKLLAQFGKVGSARDEEEIYMLRSRDFLPPPKSLAFGKTNHVIAVRFSNFLFTLLWPFCTCCSFCSIIALRKICTMPFLRS